MYIEGVDLGYSNGTTNFYKMLGTTFNADGDKITSLSGQIGSIVAGKNYSSYFANHPINGYIDEISANQGTLLFKCNGGKGRAVSYKEPTKKYKTIYSSFVFGGLRGIPEKNALMKIYMDWLLGGTGINQDQLALIANSLFITNAFGENRINFTLAQPAKISINLYTIAGKLVSRMADNPFSQGSHQLTLNKDLISSGNYLLRVKAAEQAVNLLIFITK